MKKIVILALDGMMDSSLAITLDTLQVARQIWARSGGAAEQIRLQTVGAEPTVRAGNGMQLTVDATFPEVAGITSDWVIVPGLGLGSEEEIVSRLARRDARTAVEFLQLMSERGAQLGASCAAVFLLAEAGVLEGRAATTTWWFARAFRARYPGIRLDESRMVVRDGNYWSAGSAFSQLDLVLAIISEAIGPSVAHRCSRYLLIDRRPSQARYMIQGHMQHDDPTVVAAERWIDEHLSAPITVAALSSALATSPKTLARRIEAATGVSTIKFVQRRRLLRAAHLIETTALSIEAVAEQVGYQDGSALRKLVKREFGVLPKALR